MNTVFVNIGLSLDAYMAPDGMTMGKPEHKNWGAKWGALMAWLINQQYFREKLKFGPGGETGPVNDCGQTYNLKSAYAAMGVPMPEMPRGNFATPE